METGIPVGKRHSVDGAPLTLLEVGIPWNRRSSRGVLQRVGKEARGGNRLSANWRTGTVAKGSFSLSVPSVARGIKQCPETQRGAALQGRTYWDSQGSRANRQ